MDSAHVHAPLPTGPTRRRRWLWAAAGGALVLALVGTVTALTVSGAGRSEPETLLPPTTSPTLLPPTTSPTPIPAAETSAAFLGDSYTQGVGASEPARRWSALVAADSGWVEVNLGLGGTGFVTTSGPGACGLDFCPTYPARVPDVIAAQPDIVVIAGGQNDMGLFNVDPDAVRAAVTETYDQIRQGLPEARIIVVGPSLAQPSNSQIAKLAEWVRSEAARVDAEYVNLLDPVLIQPEMVTVDGVHVNDAGHRAIADRVLAGIRSN